MRKFNYLLFLILLFSSCNKIIQIPNNNSFISYDEVKSKTELVQSYIFSIYDDLYNVFNNQNQNSPNNNLSVIVGAFSDEFVSNVSIADPTINHAYINTYYSNEGNIPNFFTSMYRIIVRCNNILDRFIDSNSEEMKQLGAEIKTIRAIIYFYLIQLYQEIPLLISSDIDDNFMVSRTNAKSIYDFCISELEFAYSVIEENNLKLSSSVPEYYYTERINKNVVMYYLSAFYLLKSDYPNSIKYSLILKDNFDFELNYEKKFEISSKENIWLLNPSVSINSMFYNNANSAFLHYKLLPAANVFSSFSRPFSISDSLINNMKHNDKRKFHFIDSAFFEAKWRYLPYKYKVIGNYNYNNVKEQFAIIRLPMVYLNLIEAYYMNKQVDLSINIYNELNNVNYSNYTFSNSLDIHDIVLERYREMFSEQGDRWFTLKRTGLLDSIMELTMPIKSNNQLQWNPDKMKYLPIPLQETINNPNL